MKDNTLTSGKITKYAQIASALKNDIARGKMQPNDQLPSFAEMIEHFGVAKHTIERAHAILEQEGLIRREQGRGVFVNHPVQRKTTGNVGFLVPYNMQPEQDVTCWGAAVAGMRSAARDRGYHLLLIDNGDDFESWDKIDGAILCDTHDPRDPQPATQQPPDGFPCMAIINQMQGAACISMDDVNGVYQLTRHLIELGHRRIAYLGVIETELSQLEQRKEGYLKALKEAGVEPNHRWMRELRWQPEWDKFPNWYPAAGEYYTHKWLEEDWAELGCTALVVLNDDAAQGAIRALRADGLEVPRDVSVVGYDGLPARSGEPELTTIHAPLFDVGERAMRSLLDYLQNPAMKPRDVCLPVNLVVGETTAAAPNLAH